MQWRIGLCGLLGGATALLGAATAGDTVPAAPSARSARLLAPQLPTANDWPPIARAQADPLPPLGMTPVRKAVPPPTVNSGTATAAPSWLNGTAPTDTILLATASLPASTNSAVRAANADSRRADTSAKTHDSSARWFAASAARQTSTSAEANNPPQVSTPFRATTPTGATIYAGPPAYRWYGYGAATPPAFLFHNQGQYPRASADWYHITGATPGAFPVPIPAPPLTGSPASIAVPNASVPTPTPVPTPSLVHDNTPPPVLPTPLPLQSPSAKPASTTPSTPSAVFGPVASPISPTTHINPPVTPVSGGGIRSAEAGTIQPAVFKTSESSRLFPPSQGLPSQDFGDGLPWKPAAAPLPHRDLPTPVLHSSPNPASFNDSLTIPPQ